MYELDLDLNTCTAIDVIQRSIVCHPTLFADCLKKQINEDSAYASGKEHDKRLHDAIFARRDACERALIYVENEDSDLFKNDNSAGIIALNEACRIQLIPAYLRTSLAVKTWESP